MSNGRKPDDKENEEKKGNIDDLPQDFFLHTLPPYLDPQSLGILPRLSRYWHRLFSHEDPWKISLITHLGVKKEVLDQFEKLRNEKKISFHYKQMYAGYYRLKQIQKKKLFSKFHGLGGLESMLSHENMQFFVLACCANDASLFTWIPRELRFSCHLLGASLRSDAFEKFFDLNLYNYKQIDSLLELGVFFNNTSLVKKLVELNEERDQKIIATNRQIADARSLNNRKFTQELLALAESLPPSFIPIYNFNWAPISDNLESLEVLLALKDENGQPRLIPDIETLNAAASSGNLALVQTLLALKDENGQPRLIPSIRTLNGARESGNLALVEYLLALKDENGNPRFIRNINMLNDAVSSVMPEVLEILLALNDKNGWPPELLATTRILNEAARSGCLALVQTLLALKNEQGQPRLIPDIDTLYIAVESGNLALVETLLTLKDEKGQPRLIPDENTLLNVSSDNLELIQALLALKDEKGNPRLIPNISTLNAAAWSGNLTLVETLLALKDEKGQPRLIPDIETFDYAVKSGNIALVQALLALKDKKGQPRFTPNYYTLNIATKSGNIALVQALLTLKDEKGQPRLIPDIETLNIAAKSGNLAFVQTLLELKDEKGQPRLIPDIETLDNAVRSGNPALVHELIRHELIRHELIGYNIFEFYRVLVTSGDDLPNDLENYLSSCFNMLSAYRAIVQNNNTHKAAAYLKRAYETFSLFFFEDLDDMLKHLTESHRHEKLIPLIHQVVADLIQTQLARTDLPLCEIEILKRKQNEFAATIEPPTQHRKI